MNAKDYFQVGVIAGTHALKGEVRVFPMTDDPERFTKGLTLLLVTKRGEERQLTVERARRNGKFVLLKFEGLDRIEDVERFAKDALYVHRDDAIPLAEGEYYVADLIGLGVFDEEDTEVGTLTDVIETGANDVYEVRLTPDYAAKNTDGARPGRMPHTVLLPATGECILQVDLEERRMKVHMLPGLI